jgi:hypothetical protein
MMKPTGLHPAPSGENNRELLGVAIELIDSAARQQALTSAELHGLRDTLERVRRADPAMRLTDRQREILGGALSTRRGGDEPMAPILTPAQVEKTIDIFGGAAIGMGPPCLAGLVLAPVLADATLPVFGIIAGAVLGAAVGAIRGLQPLR